MIDPTRLEPDFTQAIYFCRLCGRFLLTRAPQERLRREFFRDHPCDVPAADALAADDLEWARSVLAKSPAIGSS